MRRGTLISLCHLEEATTQEEARAHAGSEGIAISPSLRSNKKALARVSRGAPPSRVQDGGGAGI